MWGGSLTAPMHAHTQTRRTRTRTRTHMRARTHARTHTRVRARTHKHLYPAAAFFVTAFWNDYKAEVALRGDVLKRVGNEQYVDMKNRYG